MEDLYETDYYRWIQQQKALLLERRFDQVDLDRLIEEIDDMGRSEPRALESHLVTLLLHLLKYQYQAFILNPRLPEPKEFRSWYDSIDRARDDIVRLSKSSPHLKHEFNKALDSAYPYAKKAAIREMNRYLLEHQQLNNKSFPGKSPWSFEQVMEEGWLPQTAI